MIEVKIPVEIQEYKSKFIAGLSVRQFASIAGAIIVGIIICLLGRKHLSEDTLGWIVIISVVPFVGYGFVTYKGMKFEEFIKHWFSMNFFSQKRFYETSDYDVLTSITEQIAEGIVKQERIDKGEYYDESEDEE